MTQTMFGEAKIGAVGSLMRRDNNVVVIGGAGFGGLLHSKYVKPLFDEFDDRILRTPGVKLGIIGSNLRLVVVGGLIGLGLVVGCNRRRAGAVCLNAGADQCEGRSPHHFTFLRMEYP